MSQFSVDQIFCAVLLQAIWKEISPKLRNCWVAKKLMSHTFFVKCLVLKEYFSETIQYIGLKFSEITEMLFQYSEVLFY